MGTTKYNFYRYHGVPHSVLSLNCYQAELAESSICNKHVSNTFPAMYHGHGIKFWVVELQAVLQDCVS